MERGEEKKRLNDVVFVFRFSGPTLLGLDHTLDSTSKMRVKKLRTSWRETLAMLYSDSQAKYRTRASGSLKQDRTGGISSLR